MPIGKRRSRTKRVLLRRQDEVWMGRVWPMKSPRVRVGWAQKAPWWGEAAKAARRCTQLDACARSRSAVERETSLSR